MGDQKEDKKNNRSLRRKRIIGFTAIVLIILIFSCVLELTSIIILKAKGKKIYSFLISLPGKEEVKNKLAIMHNYLDPHLGYSHNNEKMRLKNPYYTLDGFAVYTNKKSKDEKAIKIIVLGGSTTDPKFKYCWPKQLYDIFEEKGIKCEILNGGVAGYSSNQELLKVIRDCLPLKPGIIISMNGINDIATSHSLKGHPMVEPYQKKIFERIVKRLKKASPIFPNTVSLIKSLLIKEEKSIRGINYGPVVRTTPWDQWRRNIMIIGTIAGKFDIKYLCFLQPVLGFGDYNPIPAEVEMIKRKGEDYFKVVNLFYGKAKEYSKGLPNCVDITNVFAGQVGMYKDPRHPNKEGYRVIAETVFFELMKNQ
jgi:lysophospholipase L1-like esterase